jgi:2-polyprenyl-3-methyl-5-hydroxy-6-metoxy-1,4-benzoquinol methylase
MAAIQAQPSEEQMSEDWLRGYFFVMDGSDVLGNTERKGVWKNVDFLRLRDVVLHLLDPRPGTSILDVGCAYGATMVYCGLQGATVYGQDLSEKMVAHANKNLKRYHLKGEARVGDATRLTFPDAMFDGVITSDFVEHITDDDKVAMMKEALRVLKPGGVLMTKTPNLTYLRLSLAYKRFRALLRLENPMKYVIPHTPGTEENPEHIGLTTRPALTRCLLEAGFLNYQFFYAPLRRFGPSRVLELLSTEVPWVRDGFCEDLFCRAYKPIVLSHFPD